MLTIDETIAALHALRDKVGGDAEVVLMTCEGEHDCYEIDYPIVGDFTDSSDHEFKCALVGSIYGEEFTETGTPHYKWHPSKNEVKVPTRFDGYVQLAGKTFPEPTIVLPAGT